MLPPMTTDFIPPEPATLTLEEHTQQALHVLGQIIGGVALKGSLAEDGARAAQDTVARLLAHQQHQHQGLLEEILHALDSVAFSGDLAIGEDAIANLEALIEDIKSRGLEGVVDVDARFVPHQLSENHRNRAIDLLWPRLTGADRQAKADLLDEVYPGLVHGAPYNDLTLALQRRFQEEEQAAKQRSALSTEELLARRADAVSEAFWRYTPDEELASFHDTVMEALDLDQSLTRAHLHAVFEALDGDTRSALVQWGFSDTPTREAVFEEVRTKREALHLVVDNLSQGDTIQLD